MESLDGCSNSFSLLPREPEPAGCPGRDVEGLGRGENDGGLLFTGGGPLLVSMETGVVGGASSGEAGAMHCNDYTID